MIVPWLLYFSHFCRHKTILNQCIGKEIINSQNIIKNQRWLLKLKGGKKNFLLEFMDVSNEERNKIIRFIRDPSHHDLVDKSKNLHSMVIALFYHKNKQENFIQNVRVRLKLCFFEKYILHLLIFFFFLRLMFNSSKRYQKMISINFLGSFLQEKSHT